MIYLDYSATTPMSEYALDIYCKVAKDYYGNPSSLHDIGTLSNNILTASRKKLAALIHAAAPKGIYFTSGGSESNYLSILSLARANKHRGNHLITTANEHPSVLNTFSILRKEGFEVDYIPIDDFGRVKIDKLQETITSKTILASIAHANAELGTVQNIEEIGAVLADKGILFHSDCVQSFGKIPIDVQKSNITAISVSAHKVYGPKGVGFCYINPKIHWEEVVPDTTHEGGFRQGTVNVPGICAFAAAAEETCSQMGDEQERLGRLRTYLVNKLKDDSFIFEGHPTERLQHHIAMRIAGIEGQLVMLECNRRGFAISTGSACKVGEAAPPKSMVALNRSKTEAHEFIRVTFGKQTLKTDVEQFVHCLLDIQENFIRNKQKGEKQL